MRLHVFECARAWFTKFLRRIRFLDLEREIKCYYMWAPRNFRVKNKHVEDVDQLHSSQLVKFMWLLVMKKHGLSVNIIKSP